MIAHVFSQDKYLSDVAYHFAPQFALNLERNIGEIDTKLGKLEVAQSRDEFGTYFLGAFEAGTLVAYLTISGPDEEIGAPFEHVGYSVVEPPKRGNGLTRALIEWWVGRYRRPLLSDEGHTSEGRGVWESMITRDPIFDFEIWLRDENMFRPLSIVNGVIAPNPWDGSPNRLIAFPR